MAVLSARNSIWPILACFTAPAMSVVIVPSCTTRTQPAARHSTHTCAWSPSVPTRTFGWSARVTLWAAGAPWGLA
jgi:hypothetical protein